jgi:transposase InsO family protein
MLDQELLQKNPPLEQTNASHVSPEKIEKTRREIQEVRDIEAQADRLCQDAHRRGERLSKADAIMRACADVGIGKTCYYERRKRFAQADWDERRIAGKRRSSHNKTRLTKAQLHFVDTIFARFYASATSTARVTKKVLYSTYATGYLERSRGYWIDPKKCDGDIPESLISELLDVKIHIDSILANEEKRACLSEIKLPSRGWWYGYARYFESSQQARQLYDKRYGEGEWEKIFTSFDTFTHLASLPLQYVFADHYLLDVFTVDEETRSKPYRLWVTVLIDVFTRSILGFFLSPAGPCIESIQGALRHAIWPKGSLEHLGILRPYLPYGMPQQLSLDNAWAHHSHSLEHLVQRLSAEGKYNAMELVFRPPYKARYGALVERFFGNFSAKIRQLLTGAIQSYEPRDRQNAVKYACFLFHDIERFLYQTITEYHHSPHSELNGMTPHQKWEEGTQYLPLLVPPLDTERERMFWRMDPGTRQISSKGIHAFAMSYWSPELDNLERVNRQGQKVEYSFNYDPDDLRCIALFRDGAYQCDLYAKELRLPDGSYQRISVKERELAKTLAQEKSGASRDWLAYLDELRGVTDARRRERDEAQRSRQQNAASTSRQQRASTQPASAADAALQQQRDEPSDYGDLLKGFAADD